MSVLVNIDVPDLDEGVAFYTRAFGLTASRRLGHGVAELSGWPTLVYLLERPSGSAAAPGPARDYGRHWTPVHLDVVAPDLDAALRRALDAGARLERGIETERWGKIAGLADPFGHGWCLIEFLGRGYDELVAAPRS